MHLLVYVTYMLEGQSSLGSRAHKVSESASEGVLNWTYNPGRTTLQFGLHSRKDCVCCALGWRVCLEGEL